MTIRAAIVGAGYIADWHIAAIKAVPGIVVAAIVDLSQSAAEAMGAIYGAPSYTSLSDVAGQVDVAYILTPPASHKALALEAIGLGLHVLVEKPVAMSAAETAEIAAAAQAAGKIFHAGHNFLGLPSYQRLRDSVLGGRLGRITSADICWHFPLAPLRSGPYGLWMLREPGNLLLELGAHLFAFAVDLFGPVEVLSVTLGKPIELPGGAGERPQSWRITARAGDVDLNISLQLVESTDDRSVTVRGSSGMARLDYANDVLTMTRENASEIVLNPLRRELGGAWGHLREGLRNLGRQTVSLNKKSAYAMGFIGCTRALVTAIETDTPAAAFDGTAAEAVMAGIDGALAQLPKFEAPAIPKPTRAPQPTVLVIGGTGFIGRALTRRLVAEGRDVRVLSRGRHGPFGDLPENVEIMSASLRDPEGLAQAMEGIEVVYHLGKALEETWEAALKNDVEVTENIAEAALSAGVTRFVYTGTIASYDMSSAAVTITEDTPFGYMGDRNIYARSKAECEKRLLKMHEERGLPLVIARPGIVVGDGGPLQHWGIGRWHGAGAVKIWGRGQNILPFVLNDDIADGLYKAALVDEAVGQSFNLTGDPMLTARGYFDAIHSRMGARIKVASGNLYGFWAVDGVKSVLKTYALRRKNVVRASLKDWKSRAHFSPFDNTRAKVVLGWQPEADQERFLERAIDQANLFGF